MVGIFTDLKHGFFVLVAVILRYLDQGKFMHLLRIDFQGGRKLNTLIPVLKSTLNHELTIRH